MPTQTKRDSSGRGQSSDGKVYDTEEKLTDEATVNEKLQDTSALVAASNAAAEKKKASPSPPPALTGLAAAAEAERKRRAAKSQAEAVEKR